MKKVLYFSVVLSLILASCKRTPDPVADFKVESSSFVVGQELYFENLSTDAVSFDWDFGDGYGSDEANPFHIYNSNGTFTVTLTATGEDGKESVSTMNLVIKIPTLLVIDVVEWSDDPNAYYIVPGVEVRLYESIIDWDAANEKWLYMGTTDASGSTVFSNLGPYVYYVDAFKGYNVSNGYDNYTLRDEDVDFITTPVVKPNYVNFFVAYVDPVDHRNKGEAASRSRFVIKKIVSRDAVPVLKAMKQDNWKELYERSIK
ncbi:MAG TPA: PKD domain-containing protein [Bacteroidales bacterium]|nr:PKD domain-containing protein [Bacteroidales bacterium]